MIENYAPLFSLFDGTEITKDEILEWKELHVDTSTIQSKWWDKVEKEEGRKKSVVRGIFLWIMFFIKWFFPMVLSIVGGFFLPEISMKSLNCILYPLQVVFSLYGFLYAYLFIILVAGKTKYDELVNKDSE